MRLHDSPSVWMLTRLVGGYSCATCLSFTLRRVTRVSQSSPTFSPAESLIYLRVSPTQCLTRFSERGCWSGSLVVVGLGILTEFVIILVWTLGLSSHVCLHHACIHSVHPLVLYMSACTLISSLMTLEGSIPSTYRVAPFHAPNRSCMFFSHVPSKDIFPCMITISNNFIRISLDLHSCEMSKPNAKEYKSKTRRRWQDHSRWV
jgi:hypothetical protein